MEVQLFFDTERYHYQVLNIGWKEQEEFIESSFMLISKTTKFGYKEIV
nr:element excision factor XisI family protein [uncultured Nostoc sp.]